MSNNFGFVLPVTGLPLGNPGHVSRGGLRIIRSRRVLSTAANPISFGQPVVINTANNAYESVADFINGGGTSTAALFAGVAIEEVNTNAGYPYTPGSAVTGSYLQGDPAEVLELGTGILVQVNVGTPASQGTVYVRVSANGGNTIIGGFEATSDSTHTVALTNAVFTGQVDSNGVAEIAILSPLAA
jgi:hypothetical protein